MKRDVNAFRERFNRWKLGDKVYESGRPLPAYEGGKDSMILVHNLEDDTFSGTATTLPDTVITGKKPLYPGRIGPVKQQVTFGDIADLGNTVGLSIIPGISDVADAATVANDVQNKNYLSAGIGVGLLTLPNVIEKPFKGVIRTLKAPGTKRVINDIITDPKRVIRDYTSGDYPITVAQRRKFIERRNSYFDSLADKANAYEMGLRIKRIERSPDTMIHSNFINRPNYFAPRLRRDGRKEVEGLYRRRTETMVVPNRLNERSNFNDYRGVEADLTFYHEYTHHLQNHPEFAPNLRLSRPSNVTKYYAPDFKLLHHHSTEYNPFTAMEDAHNVAEYAVFAGEDIPLSTHAMSPDEAVADLRSFILTPGIDINSPHVQLYFLNEYGMNADDIKMAIDLGY